MQRQLENKTHQAGRGVASADLMIKRRNRMKVLSVKNPISYLICSGVKTVENRSWKTNYRGRLLIHSSGKGFAYDFHKEDFPAQIFEILKSKKYKNNIKDAPEWYIALHNFVYNKMLPFYKLNSTEELKTLSTDQKPYMICSAIIGEVTIANCVKNSYNEFAEENQWNWILNNPILYDEPIYPIAGKLGLWNYTKERGA
jgi:hypothetical protein